MEVLEHWFSFTFFAVLEDVVDNLNSRTEGLEIFGLEETISGSMRLLSRATIANRNIAKVPCRTASLRRRDQDWVDILSVERARRSFS